MGSGSREGSAEVGKVDSAGPQESAAEVAPSESLIYHLAECLPFSLPFVGSQIQSQHSHKASVEQGPPLMTSLYVLSNDPSGNQPHGVFRRRSVHPVLVCS